MLIYRAHRITKPDHLPAGTPRDFNLFHKKEQILYIARVNRPLPAPYSNISLFVDLSPAMMELRRAYAPVTSILQEHKITYRWGFPTKLLVTYQQKIIPIMSPKDGYKKLTNWGLLPIPPTSAASCSLTNSSSPPRSLRKQVDKG